MRRASIFGAVLASLAACGDTVGDTTLDIVYDPCERIALAPAADATTSELAAIDAAAALWRDVIDAELVRGDAGGVVLPIRFEDAAGAFRGVYLDEDGVVVVNRQLDGSPVQVIALAHELGHAFGLWHVDADERVSVMNHGNTDVVPNDGDAAAIEALWGDCAARRVQPLKR